MSIRKSASIFIGCLLMCVQVARSQVGEPSSFTVTVKQGGITLATKNVTAGSPGSDLPDIKISDGNAESFTQIGTVGGSNPMILKVVTEDNATFRLLHMYIDVPISLQNINAAGPVSLFDPSNPGLIDVQVSNMVFNNAVFAQPQLQADNYFFTSFMRDKGGHFYELPQANPYNFAGHGINDIQVPGTAYLDGNASQYSFSSAAGVNSSWAWQNMVNPGAATTIHNGISGGLPSTGSGYVFELGMAVAFTAVPEPGTLIFCLATGLPMILKKPRRKNLFSRKR